MAELGINILNNLANTSLDFYTDLSNDNNPVLQHIQDKPLLKFLRSGQGTFSGSKEYIDMPFVAETVTQLQSYVGDDTVTYSNPDKVKRVKFPWKETHAGLEMTETELNRNGIYVLDNSGGAQKHGNISDSEKIQLQNLMKYKMQDMMEGVLDGLDDMFHGDGTAAATDVPGIQALIPDDPANATIGGVDLSLAANAKFRNRAHCNLTGSGGQDNRWDVSQMGIAQRMQAEMRQLRRFGGRPTKALAGSDFLDQLISELLEKGNYTDSGWSSSGDTNIEVADVRYGNMVFSYDPKMDDLGMVKRCYLIDPRHLKLQVLKGYDIKRRNPTRSSAKYSLLKGIQWKGAMTIDKPNTCSVIEFK